MIFTPHIIVGAAIGAKIQNLGLIIILGLTIHFIMDKFPHWDYSWAGVKNFKKTKGFKLLLLDFLKMAIDILIGLLIVFLIIWYKDILNFDYLPFILFGIFISLLPDILYGLSWFLIGKPNKFTKFIEDLHSSKHIKKPTLVGLGTEILITIIACVVLLNL